MGIGKMLGMDSFKTMRLQKKLTLEELYELIKDAKYPCGTPEIATQGLGKLIKFPGDGVQAIQITLGTGMISVAVLADGMSGLAKEWL